MAQHLTEEEQIEALKRWWKENWLSVVLPIVVAVVGYVGWTLWQDNREQRAQVASDQYQQLLEMVEVEPGSDLTDEQKTNVRAQATSIMEQFGDSMYADLSGLVLAKLAVEDDNYQEAESILRTVAAQSDNAGLVQLANARLAKVLLNLGKHDEALSLVGQPQDQAYKSLYSEVRGDIYLAQDKPQEAHTAYQQALEALDPQQFSRRGLLQVKLDSTAVAEVDLGSVEQAMEDSTTAEGDSQVNEEADGAAESELASGDESDIESAAEANQ